MKQVKNKRVLCQGIFLVALMLVFVLAGIVKSAMAKESGLNIPAYVMAPKLNVRKAPSVTAKKVKVSGEEVSLSAGKNVTILSEEINEKKEAWYKISFQWNGTDKTGYVMALYVKMKLNQPQKANISIPKKNNGKILYADNKMTAKTKDSKGKDISLPNGKQIQILNETEINGKKAFFIKTTLNKIKYKGYIEASMVKLQSYMGIPTGTVTDGPLNVRQGAGTANAVVEYKSKRVQLAVGDKVNILSNKNVSGVKWYQVTFDYKSGNETVKLSGYVIGSCVSVDETKTPEPSKTPKPSANPTKKPTEKPTEEPTEKPSEKPTEEPTEPPASSRNPQTEEEFKASLKKFPASYRESLKQLHKTYPYWRFEVYNTGLDWEEVIKNESKVGLNLIPVGKSSGWLSYEPGAYDWATDTFKIFDGSIWVTCSKEALCYYMDPRNFLTTDGVFQFENLAYSEGVQNISGVRAILRGTVLENGVYTYKDKNGKKVTLSYAETIMKAAKQSGVSPYHLASRIKQEVVVSGGLSNSANGKLSGFEGIYNFYNIGANDSAIAGQNIINGLTFAKTGNRLSQADKDKYLIPWDSPYNAIVGGAKYIGSTYINRGQNTIYLQKFNVTAYSRYIHQYMSNVEAAKAEGQKMYEAYKGMENEQVTFNIPVYENMPETPQGIPDQVFNPNNWLKSISVYNQSGEELVMTPSFNVSDPEGTVYKLYVKKKVSYVTINAQTVSTLSTVRGTGTFELKKGTNTFKITVTAQSGAKRVYTVEIVRSS